MKHQEINSINNNLRYNPAVNFHPYLRDFVNKKGKW